MKPFFVPKLFLLFLSLFHTSFLQAQTCLPGGIVFESQAAIDSFPFHYPNCQSIEGNVVINSLDIVN